MARRLGLSVDLNVVPEEVQSFGVNACADSEDRQGTFRRVVSSPLVIDVDDFDDEVLPSSSKAFHQARKKSRIINKRSLVISDDDKDVEICRVRKRKRSTLCQQRRHINPKDYIDLEAAPMKQGDNVKKQAQSTQQVAAPEAHTFTCPICMEKLKNETSTKCGHIFCEDCIKKALSAKKCCPACRKKLRAKDIIRIYLPNVNIG